MNRMTLSIGGMSCGHCVGAVKRALEGVEGVKVEQVSVGQATIEYEPATASPEKITEAIADEGYAVLSTTP
jgi:copper chaperone CopZ